MSGVETYTGAWFTLRYDQCKSRITGWGLGAALDAVLSASGTILSTADYPLFNAVKADIVAQAEQKYMYREISAETPDQWTYYAKTLWTELVRKYEDVLDLEASVDVTSADITAQKFLHGRNVDTSLQDTPYGQLSQSSDYVTQRSTTGYSGTDTVSNRDALDSEIVAKYRDRWQPTVLKIVDELGELFVSIIGGDFIL